MLPDRAVSVLPMKSRQFCSVCKQKLDMEVVPTADGDDDGVVWFRCPQCQGFLPKLSSALGAGTAVDDVPGDAADSGRGGGSRSHGIEVVGDGADPLPDPMETPDLPADGPDVGIGVGRDLVDDREPDDDDAGEDDADDDGADEEDLDGDDQASDDNDSPSSVSPSAGPSEPVLEYAAMLAAVDPATAVPYRPWETYEVGQCVLHLAWNDCGIVVAKEALPGGRRVVKCWFQGAGVVRLIENAPR